MSCVCISLGLGVRRGLEYFNSTYCLFIYSLVKREISILVVKYIIYVVNIYF